MPRIPARENGPHVGRSASSFADYSWSSSVAVATDSSSEPQEADSSAGHELLFTGGDEDECVRARGPGDHVRLLPGHDLQLDLAGGHARTSPDELGPHSV